MSHNKLDNWSTVQLEENLKVYFPYLNSWEMHDFHLVSRNAQKILSVLHYDLVLLHLVQKYPEVNKWGSVVLDQYCIQFWLYGERGLELYSNHCSHFSSAPPPPPQQGLVKNTEQGFYWTSMLPHRNAGAHTYTPTLAVHLGLPSSNRELQVWRVSANRKAGIEGVK